MSLRSLLLLVWIDFVADCSCTAIVSRRVCVVLSQGCGG